MVNKRGDTINSIAPNSLPVKNASSAMKNRAPLCDRLKRRENVSWRYNSLSIGESFVRIEFALAPRHVHGITDITNSLLTMRKRIVVCNYQSDVTRDGELKHTKVERHIVIY